MTTVHKRYDSRILKKECVSLANAGYDVTLLVADNLPDENYKNVKISSIDFSPKNRLDRILNSKKQMLKKALLIDADVYHFHDPELIPVGLSLKKKNKKVIYDSHEDYVSALKEKKYIPKFLRKAISLAYESYEKYACKHFDGTVCCYHWTLNRLEKYCNNIQMVFNFPILEDNFLCHKKTNNINTFVYAGLVSDIWNHDVLINALNILKNAKYLLAGPIENDYFDELKSLEGWKYVNYMGLLTYQQVLEDVYSQATAGIALLGYIELTKNKIGNLSNTKLFEYMMSGLPVICTDFELWKEIINDYDCGICVNPYNSKSVANAIKLLEENPERAKTMGENGRRAVEEKYNWGREEKKIFALYESVVNDYKGEQYD